MINMLMEKQQKFGSISLVIAKTELKTIKTFWLDYWEKKDVNAFWMLHVAQGKYFFLNLYLIEIYNSNSIFLNRVDSEMLVEEGFEVVSIDASDKMLKYALKARWNRRSEKNFENWSELSTVDIF